jgi:hypothetical protein
MLPTFIGLVIFSVGFVFSVSNTKYHILCTLLVKERINYIYYCNIFDTCTNSIPYANYLISYPRLEHLNNWTMEFRIAKCTLGNAPYKTKTDIVDCFLPNPLLFS